MKLLSFDLALAETGWALLSDGALDTYGVIRTHPQASPWERIVDDFLKEMRLHPQRYT